MMLYVRKCSVPWGKSRLWELRHAGTDLTVMMTVIKPIFGEGCLVGNIRFEGWEGTVSEGTENKSYEAWSHSIHLFGVGEGVAKLWEGKEHGEQQEAGVTEKLTLEPMELSTWDLLEVTYAIKGQSDCSKKTDLPEASIKVESPVQVLGTSQSSRPGQR